MIERRAAQNLTDLHKDLAAHQAGPSFGKNIRTTPSPGRRASVSAVASMRNKLPATRLRPAEFLHRATPGRRWRCPWTPGTPLVRRRRTQPDEYPTDSSVFATRTEYW